MERTVVGVFDSEQHAQAARQEVLACGVPENRIHIESGSASGTRNMCDEQRHEGGFLAWIRELFEGPDDHSREYSEAVRRGSYVVVADAVDDDRLELVTAALSRHGAIDIDKRVADWRSDGWSGGAGVATAATGDTQAQAAGIAGGMRTDRFDEHQMFGDDTAANNTLAAQDQRMASDRAQVMDRGGVRIHTRPTTLSGGMGGMSSVADGPDIGAAGVTSGGATAGGAIDADDLNTVLRDELSATETYRQALDKNRDEYGNDARYQQLAQMLRDHEQAATQIRNLIVRRGGTASDDSGAWGTWSNAVMGTARLFGDKAALKALKEGEESGIKDYEALLRDGSPSEVRSVVSSIVAREQEHVRELDRLIQTA